MSWRDGRQEEGSDAEVDALEQMSLPFLMVIQFNSVLVHLIL